MDSNNGFDNIQPSGVQPEPLNLEHSMEPLQPTQPMQPAQPVQPAQPIQPVPPMDSKEHKKPNFLLIGIIAVALVVVAIVLVIVALNFAGGQKSQPAQPTPTPESETEVTDGLTADLAKSVCEKNNGIFEEVEQGSNQADFEAIYTCKYYKNAQETDSGYYVSTYVAGDFEYQLSFLKEDKIEEYWIKSKESSKEITDNNIKVLKDTSGIAGYYGSILVNDQDGRGLRSYVYALLFDNIVFTLSTYGQSDTLAKNLLEELNVQDPEKINNNITGDQSGVEARDAQRKIDYSAIITAVNSYMASNNGKISNMVKSADPHTLTASKWINETGLDPNNAPYELKAYSWDAWNKAPATPFGNEGSQVFIVINANCNGVDKDGNHMPAKDEATRSFAVYGYLENGYFCQASGSAS